MQRIYTERERKKAWTNKIFLSILFPAIVTLTYYIFNLSQIHNSTYLNEYWKNGFDIFSISIYKINFEFLFQYYNFSFLLLILIIIGLFHLFKFNKLCFIQFVGVLALTLTGALLKIYPFERRLILFLTPVLIIISIYPMNNLRAAIKSYAAVLISLLFFSSGILNFAKEYISGNVSYLRQDVKPLLKVISSEKDTQVYLYYGSFPSWGYYSELMRLPIAHIGTYPYDENISEKFLIKDLNSLSPGQWYLFFVKGTWTYDKDMSAAKTWLAENCRTLKEYNLKSAYLVKIIK